MAHNSFLAKMASEELRDTLFFGGFNYTREKSQVRGQLTYTYTAPNLQLIISGRNIRINGEKMGGVSHAKRRLQSLIDI
jgi:hypothetical protein